jgi:predicted RNA binding protein YcfA (HicA-like mRNA interferase family)
MKRAKLVRYLEEHGCYLIREGAGHSVFVNFKTNEMTTVPRHTELGDNLAKEICKQPGIPKIRKGK